MALLLFVTCLWGIDCALSSLCKLFFWYFLVNVNCVLSWCPLLVFFITCKERIYMLCLLQRCFTLCYCMRSVLLVLWLCSCQLTGGYCVRVLLLGHLYMRAIWNRIEHCPSFYERMLEWFIGESLMDWEQMCTQVLFSLLVHYLLKCYLFE